jgi:hypothetical protein
MNHILYLKVENAVRSVKVTEIPHPHHALFHVLFEDGYENMFFNDVETGRWIEEDLGETLLATAFGLEIKQITAHRWHCPKILQWHKDITGSGPVHFGFYKYRLDDCFVYEIYRSNMKFRYSLVKTGCQTWEIFGAYNLIVEEENAETVKLIAEILDSYNSCL